MIKLVACCVALMGAGAAIGQTLAPPPQNVLQLSADGTVEVQQDLLTMTLAVTRSGANASAVQTQLKSTLDAALAEARAQVRSGQFDMHTGNFSLGPRYNRDGKITGWEGSAELVLEGRDFPRVTETAGRLTALNVTQVGFGLSRERRAQAEEEAQSLAIAAFGKKATALARGFGFSGYTLREVAVSANQSHPYQPRMRAMAVSKSLAEADAAVPVEAGKSTVVVTVSGSVQLK